MNGSFQNSLMYFKYSQILMKQWFCIYLSKEKESEREKPMMFCYCDHNNYWEIITIFNSRFQGFEVPTSRFLIMNEASHILYLLDTGSDYFCMSVQLSFFLWYSEMQENTVDTCSKECSILLSLRVMLRHGANSTCSKPPPCWKLGERKAVKFIVDTW